MICEVATLKSKAYMNVGFRVMADSNDENEKRRRRAESRFLGRARKRQLVHRGDAFDDAFFSYLGSSVVEHSHQMLTEKRFTLKRTDVGTRVVNHWESEGVVEDPRENGTGWRRFSILDIVWLHSVARLREFGMPMGKLKYSRRSLASLGSGQTDEGSTVTYYEFYLTRALLRIPVSLIVFRDGEAEIATENEYGGILTRLTGGLADHIRVDVNSILQQLFSSVDLSPKHDPSLSVTDEELDILLMLRTGNFESLTVKLKNGEIERLEAEEMIREGRIVDLLNDWDFQDLTIRRRDGENVHVSRTLLKKV